MGAPPGIASKLLAYFAWPFIYMYYLQPLFIQTSILLFKQDNVNKVHTYQ